MTNYDEYEFDVNYNLVSDKNSNYQIDLKSRFLDFAVDSLRFLSTIPDQKEYNVLKYQLSKSATSIGANFEEAQSSGDKEFIYKLRIALREA